MFKNTENYQSKKRGFVLLYAVLVASVILAIGLVLSDIITKQIVLSTVGKDSQLAYYLADGGRDCAKYWWSRGAFGTVSCKGKPSVCSYTPPTPAQLSQVNCNSFSLEAPNPDISVPVYYGLPTGVAEYKFSIPYVDISNRCSDFIVRMRDDSLNPKTPRLIIVSSGYNATCESVFSGTKGRVVERVVIADK